MLIRVSERFGNKRPTGGKQECDTMLHWIFGFYKLFTFEPWEISVGAGSAKTGNVTLPAFHTE
jgi:hypothetical protein